MTSLLRRTVIECFESVLAAPLDVRAAHLATLPADVRHAVDALLAAHDPNAASPFDPPATRDLEHRVRDDLIRARLGTRLGPWRLVAPIGAGGMGIVYRAVRDDGVFDAEVAVKLVHPHLAVPAVRAAFARERQVLADLQHPAVPRLLDGGETPDGVPYLVMELVSGRPLDDAFHGANMAEVIDIMSAVGDAVHAAHQQLIAHGDLTPANILRAADGRVRLLDLGLSRAFHAASDAGIAGGTRPYLSPERRAGAPPSVPDDNFALGMILRECLAHLPRPSADLTAIADRACAESASNRYATAHAFADDLRRVRTHRPVRARSRSTFRAARLFVRRHRRACAVAGALLVVFGGLLVEMDHRRRTAQRAHLARDDAMAFLDGIFAAASPYADQPTTDARAMLHAAERRAARELDDRPDVHGRVLLSLARAAYDMASWPDAERLGRHALTCFDATPHAAPDDLARADALAMVADAITERFLGDREAYADAVRMQDAALTIAACRLRPDDPRLARMLGRAATTRITADPSAASCADAAETYRDALARLERSGARDTAIAMEFRACLALLDDITGDHRAAIAGYATTLDHIAAVPARRIELFALNRLAKLTASADPVASASWCARYRARAPHTAPTMQCASIARLTAHLELADGAPEAALHAWWAALAAECTARCVDPALTNDAAALREAKRRLDGVVDADALPAVLLLVNRGRATARAAYAHDDALLRDALLESPDHSSSDAPDV